MSLLVIDIGSSSVRSLLFDGGARLVPGAISSRPLQFTTAGDGRCDADALVIRSLVEACVDEILQHSRAQSIRAVGMASFVGNWLGLDAAGEPCAPLMTYADTRAGGQIPELRDKLGGDASAYHQATGCLLHPAYLPAQYAWLRRNDPATESRIARVCDIGGYLRRCWLGGETRTSYSVASWTGLLDTARLQWRGDYAALLGGPGLPAKLPRLADFDEPAQALLPAYARRWPQLRDCPFFPALGDGAVANVGSGAVDADRIALTIGTTSALRVVRHVKRVPDGLWRYLVTAGMPLVGGATSEGGNVYQWLQFAGLARAEDLEAQLLKREPDAHGLTVLPLLAGERAPGWQGRASGAIHGIRPHTTGLDITQAHLEAVALRLSLIFDSLKAEGAVVMAGGGALQASPAWARMIADAFNSPIHLLNEAEVTARGVALLLRNRLDGAPLQRDPPSIQAVVQPDSRRAKKLVAARQRQLDLYRRLYG